MGTTNEYKENVIVKHSLLIEIIIFVIVIILLLTLKINEVSIIEMTIHLMLSFVFMLIPTMIWFHSHSVCSSMVAKA